MLADKNCSIHEYNPLAKVPTLITNDISIFDSPVIAEYLDHKSSLPYLISNDFDKKILVKRWEAIADGLCDAAVATQTYPTITNGRTRINRMPSRIPILLPPRHGSRQATTRV